MNPLFELQRAHRSIRAFRDEPLDEELVRAAVRSAQCAATSSNVQAYALLRIVDPARRRELARLAGDQEQVAAAGGFFVVCADQRRHRLVAAEAGAPFAPNLESFLVAVIDASLFAQNLALAFESLGLGTCFIGGLRNELPAVDHLLDLPPDVLPLYGLCAGKPAADPGQRPRLPLEAVYAVDRYPTDDELRAHIADYDEISARYYAERGAPGRDWSGGIWRKFQRPRRTHLAEFYRSKGASLD